LTVGALDWQGGLLTGGGTVTVATGGTLTIEDHTSHYLGGETLTNLGTATWTHGDLILSNGAVLNNAGTLSLQPDNNWAIYNSGVATVTGNNSGTWIEASAGITNSIGNNGGVAFNNSGTVQVLSGYLAVNGGSTSS